jgi:tagaturonate reductase
MWGIEGNESLAEKLPFIKAGLPGAFVTLDVTPYKRRKVRILNGAHTGFVPGAWLAGFDIVRDCMHDEVICGFMEHMLESEVIPTLSDELDHEDLEKFSKAVANRFDNPFIDHQLLSICLNSCAKWRARNLPSLVDYVAKNHEVPACLATSLATLIGFYTTGLTSKGEDGLHLVRPDGTAYVAKDDENILSFFEKHATDSDADLVDAVMGEDGMWGHDLHKIAGLRDFVVERLGIVRKEGARAAFQACLL